MSFRSVSTSFELSGKCEGQRKSMDREESTMRHDAVISTLNRRESLKACLSLIEEQTEKPARVIIVDASD